MGFRRGIRSAGGGFQRFRNKWGKRCQGQRAREAFYLAADFAQFNGFCFLNHSCWMEGGFLARLFARCFALSHVQLSSDLSAGGSVLGWLCAIGAVVLYAGGSGCILVVAHAKLQKLRHRWCPSLRIVPERPILPPTHAIHGDPDLLEFATSVLCCALSRSLVVFGADRLCVGLRRARLPLDPTPASARNDCRKGCTALRRFVAWLLANRPLLVFIGSAGFIPITSQLLGATGCTYPAEYGRLDLDLVARPPIEPELVCWDGQHRLYIWGAFAALGLYLPLALIIDPMLRAAERGMEELHASGAAARSMVVQWSPGYSGGKLMGKLLLVTVGAWLPSSALALDVCVMVVCGGLALTAMLTTPCSSHGVLKLHVLVLVCAIATAAISIAKDLHAPEPEPPAVRECATAAGFGWMIVAWGGLAGVACLYRVWWGALCWAWRKLSKLREEERLNKKVLALAM